MTNPIKYDIIKTGWKIGLKNILLAVLVVLLEWVAEYIICFAHYFYVLADGIKKGTELTNTQKYDIIKYQSWRR